MRFDIPCVGLKTVETCAECGVAVLALEAGKTLVLDEADVGEFARRRKVSLVGGGCGVGVRFGRRAGDRAPDLPKNGWGALSLARRFVLQIAIAVSFALPNAACGSSLPP